jgi:hypothetical protein
MKFLIILAILLLPTLAHTACVTREDLPKGVTVRVVRSEGEPLVRTYRIKSLDDNLTLTQLVVDGTPYTPFLALWGIYYQNSEWQSVDGPGETRVWFSVPPVEPKPDRVWRSYTRVRSFLLSDPDTLLVNEGERWTVRFGPITETVIDGCTYRTMTVAHTHPGDRRFAHGYVQTYFVDLGFAVDIDWIGGDIVVPVEITQLRRGLK